MIRFQNSLIATTNPTNPAMIDWTIMLPVPGSKYAMSDNICDFSVKKQCHYLGARGNPVDDYCWLGATHFRASLGGGRRLDSRLASRSCE